MIQITAYVGLVLPWIAPPLRSQTQTWVRLPDGWRIVTHVSMTPFPDKTATEAASA